MHNGLGSNKHNLHALMFRNVHYAGLPKAAYLTVTVMEPIQVLDQDTDRALLEPDGPILNPGQVARAGTFDFKLDLGVIVWISVGAGVLLLGCILACAVMYKKRTRAAKIGQEDLLQSIWLGMVPPVSYMIFHLKIALFLSRAYTNSILPSCVFVTLHVCHISYPR